MIRTARLLAACAVALCAAVTVLSEPVGAASTAIGESAEKVIASDFPDPGFAKFTTQAQGTRYYLYATGAGFRVARSSAPGSGFSILGNSMTLRPGWTLESGDSRPAQLWAPHVIQTGFTAGAERFTMYFAARRESDYRHCLGTARSSSPTGPFTPAATPLLCPPAGYSEAIDPVAYVNRNGNRYLVYKIGNYEPRRFQIKAVRVDNGAGTSPAGSPRTVLSAAQIGSAVAEAPDVYRDGNGRVHLFVSRNGYRDCSYATQVWSGPELFSMGNPRWVAGMGPSSNLFCGSGGAEVLRDGSVLRIAFHARHSLDPFVRHAWTGRVKWTSAGNPYLS